MHSFVTAYVGTYSMERNHVLIHHCILEVFCTFLNCITAGLYFFKMWINISQNDVLVQKLTETG